MHRIPDELLARHHHRLPNYIASAVSRIDFAELAATGITSVLLDVDNTLVTYGARAVHSQVGPAIASARAAGYIQHLGIASNSRRNLDFLEAVIKPDRIVQPVGLGMKPSATFFGRALKELNSSADETVMIGDKLIQDIWGARRSGLTAILVKPLGRDAWFDQLLLLRPQERWLLRRYLPAHEEHWF